MTLHFPSLSVWLPCLGFLIIFFQYLVSYFWIHRSLRAIPAPFPAQFTNLWLMYICRKSRRSDTVYDLHKRLGPVVRIQPNHISIADEKAINLVYGHGNGLEKSYVRADSIGILVQPLNLTGIGTTPLSLSLAAFSQLEREPNMLERDVTYLTALLQSLHGLQSLLLPAC
jgi:hypothetical protein